MYNLFDYPAHFCVTLSGYSFVFKNRFNCFSDSLFLFCRMFCLILNNLVTPIKLRDKPNFLSDSPFLFRMFFSLLRISYRCCINFLLDSPFLLFSSITVYHLALQKSIENVKIISSSHFLTNIQRICVTLRRF